MYKLWFDRVRFGGRSLLGAVLFYTCIPLPSYWKFEFEAVARFAPTIGVLIGAILGLGDWGLGELGYPVLIRSALVVVGWVGITGGLHLDGAMDTADGLAVQDPNRRLDVMADSATGAFGAMAAVALLLLKTLALSEIESDRLLILMTVAAWGRWGQVNAIARYPYLKPTGKGAFHKAAIQPLDPWIALLLPLSLSGIQFYLTRSALIPITMAVGGIIIALLAGAWFHHKLGGHTGDTYGAVVEWTETLLLCLLTRE